MSTYVLSVAPELADRVSRYVGSKDVFAAFRIDEQIAKAPAEVAGKTELDAVVAYLQGLGKHAPRGN